MLLQNGKKIISSDIKIAVTSQTPVAGVSIVALRRDFAVVEAKKTKFIVQKFYKHRNSDSISLARFPANHHPCFFNKT
jgi:hypothetical protein